MDEQITAAITLVIAVIDHLELCYGEDEEWMVEALQQAVGHIQDARTEGE